MMAAPLIAGNDLRTMTEETRSIFTNSEVLAFDQDSLGIQGYRYDVQDSVEVWMKPLSGGDWAVCFLNRSLGAQHVSFDWKKHIITDDFSGRTLDANVTTYSIRDVWAKAPRGSTGRMLQAQVSSHDVLTVRLTKQ
jgi:alpha-galactosidase